MATARLSTVERTQLATFWTELGIDPATVRTRGLPLFGEARRLTPVGLGTDGRDRLLVPGAAQAWLSMRAAASRDGISLGLISAFRSYAYQARLIRDKLAAGRSIDAVLVVNAPPGCSEHHTGRAVDVGVDGCPALDEAFEQQPAFAWLTAHAGDHGFRLSYPRDNADGYLYEPWHWCWHARSA